MRVAIYGNLMSTYEKNSILVGLKAKLLGEYDSEPDFSMYTDGVEPFLTNDGRQSIRMEVYEIEKEKVIELNRIKQYKGPEHTKTNLFNPKPINTPYGKGLIYLYNKDIKKLEKMKVSNWGNYEKYKQIKNML